MAQSFVRRFIEDIKTEDDNGLAHYAFADMLFGDDVNGVQVGFCSELMKNVEKVLMNH